MIIFQMKGKAMNQCKNCIYLKFDEMDARGNCYGLPPVIIYKSDVRECDYKYKKKVEYWRPTVYVDDLACSLFEKHVDNT